MAVRMLVDNQNSFQNQQQQMINPLNQQIQQQQVIPQQQQIQILQSQINLLSQKSEIEKQNQRVQGQCGMEFQQSFTINHQPMNQQQALQLQQQYQQQFLAQQFGNPQAQCTAINQQIQQPQCPKQQQQQEEQIQYQQPQYQKKQEIEYNEYSQFEKIQKKQKLNEEEEENLNNNHFQGQNKMFPFMVKQQELSDQNQNSQQAHLTQKVEKQERKKVLFCEFHKQEPLTQICVSTFCMKQKINCNLCVQQFHMTHELQPIEEYIQGLSKMEKSIQDDQEKENNQWEKIRKFVDINSKYLKDLENLTTKLQRNVSKLYRTLRIIKEKQQNDNSILKSQISSLKDRYYNPQEYDISTQAQEISQIVHCLNKYEYTSITSYPQIIDIVELNEQLNSYCEHYLKDFAFYIIKVTEKQEQLEKKYDTIDFKSLKQPQKEQEGSQKLQKLSQIFHCIKGKAKKRDIINFVTWNDIKQEIKFVKDIKEKEEKSHYQLVFSLYLKNFDFLELDQINDEFMNWIRKQIMDIYPLVKKEKEDQRKLGTQKQGNKRRYCKLDFKFDIDSKNYLNCQSPLNSEENMCI